MKEFVIDEYKNGLGNIVLSLESNIDFERTWETSDRILISSDNFTINIIKTKIENSWLPIDMKVDSSNIWICLITQKSNQTIPVNFKNSIG